MLIYACDVKGALCIHWLRFTIFQVFSGIKAISSMNHLRKAYPKRERESRCRLLVMSSWADDGALVMRWKKANEAHCSKLLIFHPERSKKCFFKTSFFCLIEHIVEV